MHFNFVRKSYLLSQSFAEINALCFFADDLGRKVRSNSVWISTLR